MDFFNQVDYDSKKAFSSNGSWSGLKCLWNERTQDSWIVFIKVKMIFLFDGSKVDLDYLNDIANN